MIVKDWTSKRLIACFVLFALIFAQISIVTHTIQHPHHAFSLAASLAASNVIPDHNQQDDDKHSSTHKCPECLLTKSFYSVLTADISFNFVALVSLQSYFFTKNDVVQNVIMANYQPRAPPAFLI